LYVACSQRPGTLPVPLSSTRASTDRPQRLHSVVLNEENLSHRLLSDTATVSWWVCLWYLVPPYTPQWNEITTNTASAYPRAHLLMATIRYSLLIVTGFWSPLRLLRFCVCLKVNGHELNRLRRLGLWLQCFTALGLWLWL